MTATPFLAETSELGAAVGEENEFLFGHVELQMTYEWRY